MLLKIRGILFAEFSIYPQTILDMFYRNVVRARPEQKKEPRASFIIKHPL